MSITNKIFRIVLTFAVLASCQPQNVPLQYRTSLSQVEKNTYGAWITVGMIEPHPVTHEMIIEGELITLFLDSLYVLEADHTLVSIPKSLTNRAELVTHKNQAGTYGAIMGILLIPNIVGAAIGDPDLTGAYLLLGVPTLIVGLTVTFIEAGGNGNTLIYPEKNTWSDLRSFSRFPQGFPGDLDKNSLTLKPMK